MKIFIFAYDYKWEGNIELPISKKQVLVVVARSLEIAKAIIKTDYKISLSDRDLVATLQNNEDVWIAYPTK